jgi:serine phosphatase RsbU (regulator of sigma subunit)
VIKRWFLIFLIISPALLCAQDKIYFIGEERISTEIQSFRVKNHYNYIGMAYLQKRGRNFSLRFKTFLGEKPLTDFEVDRFSTRENVRFDFLIDENSLFIVYQSPQNRIIYRKIDSIYENPIPVRKQELSKQENKVYSIPSIYNYGKNIYILYHKESSENKMDLILQVGREGKEFTQPLNFTQDLGYAIYPEMFLLFDKIGIVFQGRPREAEGKIYFDIYSYELDLSGKILSKKRLTRDIGDNYQVDGIPEETKLLLTWENRLNNWRIMYGMLDIQSGTFSKKPEIFTSNYHNYRKPRIVRIGNSKYIFVQRIQPNSDRLYYYPLSSDNQPGEEVDTGLEIRDRYVVGAKSLWIFYLDRKGVLYRREADKEASLIKLIPYFQERTVFGEKEFKISWKDPVEEGGIDGFYYAFDRSPSTIPDEVSKLGSATRSVSLYAPQDGTWYFHIYYQDKAGNRSPVLHKEMRIDTQAPITPPLDFSANEIRDIQRNILDNNKNVTVQWKADPQVDYYFYSLSAYPRFFAHRAKTIRDNKVNFSELKPGKYFFHLQAVDKAGNKGEVISTPFFVQKYTQSPTFIDPDMMGRERVIIRKILFKNVNLVPFRPYLDRGQSDFSIIPFWDLPVTLKLKVAFSFILIFLIVFLLYLMLFVKHKKLMVEYEELQKLPSGGGAGALQQPEEIEVLPGSGEIRLKHINQKAKARYEEIFKRAETIDQEIHAIEQELKEKISPEKKERKETGPAMREKILEKAEDFLKKEEVMEAEILEPEVVEEEKEIRKKVEEPAEGRVINADGHIVVEEEEESLEEFNILEGLFDRKKERESLEAQEIKEAEEIEEAQEVEEAEEIEEPIPVEEAEEIEEVREAEEIPEEIETAETIEEAIPAEESEQIEEAVEVAQEAVEQEEISEVEALEEAVGVETGEEKEQFHEKIKLKTKYSFLITILVMFTIGMGSLISGYYTLKNNRENLGRENMRKAEIIVNSLATAVRDPLRIGDDPAMIEAIINTASIQDVLYTRVIKQDLNLNTGKMSWFFRDNRGNYKVFEKQEFIRTMVDRINQNQEARPYIQPVFNVENLQSEYTLYYPIIFIKDKDQKFTLNQDDYGKRFLGVARIDFSTQRIFNLLKSERDRIFRLTLIIAAIMVGFGLIGAILLSYITVKPITRLVQGVRTVGEGNLEHQIPISTKDEIGLLTFEFNQMTRQLKAAQEEIIKKKVLEEQFSIAEGIQRSLIPSPSMKLKDLSIQGYYKAALGVGGDYFDYFEIDEEHMAVILSDVAGKGIPAALMMVNIRTVYRTYIKQKDITPVEIVSIVNNVLAEDLSSDMFATLFFYIYNRKTRDLLFCNAGHGPLTYYSVREKQVKTVDSRTMPVGIMPDNPQYTNQETRLEPGDIAIVFTDGISEAMNTEREEFGEDRLYSIVAENADKSAEEINRAVIDALDEFVGEAPQHDDISLIIMKIK